MVYYFSGTGNSRYAAHMLGELLGEEVRSIPATGPGAERLAEGKDKTVGFVFPVYAWGVPPIVMDFIKRLPEVLTSAIRSRKVPVWCVATCGDETGLAVKMFRNGLRKRGLELSASYSLIMPNVYVLLPGFGTDPKDVEEKKLKNATERLRRIAAEISRKDWEHDILVGSLAWVKTALVYPLFRKWGVNTKRWHATDACVGCGRCSAACPVGNIAMEGGRPRWGKDCTSCCGCFHVCPTGAVQYGHVTENAGRYYLQKGIEL